MDTTKCWNPKNLFKKTEKPIPRPANREQVIEWYRSTQRPKKIGFTPEGTVCEWFHGEFKNLDKHLFFCFVKVYR